MRRPLEEVRVLRRRLDRAKILLAHCERQIQQMPMGPANVAREAFEVLAMLRQFRRDEAGEEERLRIQAEA